MKIEILKIFLTSALTITGGVIIYVFGQVVSRFLIDAIHEQKKVITEINDVLIFYANQFYLYEKYDPKAEEIANKIRSLATRLRAKTKFISWYNVFEKIGLVISKNNISKACSSLIGLSNSVYKHKDMPFGHVEAYREQISQALDIEL
jgi:hypothetical protein